MASKSMPKVLNKVLKSLARISVRSRKNRFTDIRYIEQALAISSWVIPRNLANTESLLPSPSASGFIMSIPFSLQLKV